MDKATHAISFLSGNIVSETGDQEKALLSFYNVTSTGKKAQNYIEYRYFSMLPMVPIQDSVES